MSGLEPGTQDHRNLLEKASKYLRWKVTHVASQTSQIVGQLVATRYYDAVLSRRKRTYIGAHPNRARVAIFLIFPSAGLMPSHIRALKHLIRKDIAPLVVTNLPLAESDRSVVLDHCWKLIERPNFGYDFGGYRDGILALGDQLERLEGLFLMNDSCWFPMPRSEDWIDQVDALGVDFAGAVSNYGVAATDDYRASVWHYDTTRPGFHYCSFALAMSPRLLKDAQFQAYWKRLPLTNDKFLVVRRGELALSQLVLNLGYSHGATLDIRRLDEEILVFSAEEMRDMLAHLVIPEDAQLRAMKDEKLKGFEGSEAWRHDAFRFVLSTVASTGPAYALPDYLVHTKRFAFLKKSPMWLDDDGAETTLRTIAKLGEDGAEILAEAATLRRSRANPTGPSPKSN